MDLPFVNYQQQILQQATAVHSHPTPSYQDVWIKLQHISARYNDLLRQSRDLATNNQTLASEHIRLQKELVVVRTKNEELSTDVVNHRIEAWRTNVRLEELSNEVQLLKNHRSQLLSLTKRSFDQIDNDGESAWSASCSSPISSVSTFTTQVTATPTHSTTITDHLPISNTTSSNFHSPTPHQPTATEEHTPEPTAGIQNSKRRKLIQSSIGDCKLGPAGGEAPLSYSVTSIPTNTVQGHGVNSVLMGSRPRTSPSQPRRTATRVGTRTPSTAVEGPGMRTRSRAKSISNQQEPMATADAVAAAVTDTAAITLEYPPIPVQYL